MKKNFRPELFVCFRSRAILSNQKNGPDIDWTSQSKILARITTIFKENVIRHI